MLVACPLFAAETTGTVQGTVTDASGAVLPGASVVLANKATGVRTTQMSNATGLYIFNLVPPGTYDVTGSMDGFKSITQSGLTVEINATVRADLMLTVGNRAESIEVVAETSRVDTESAQVNNTVTEKMVSELPNSTRNTLQFGHQTFASSAMNGAVNSAATTHRRIRGIHNGVNALLCNTAAHDIDQSIVDLHLIFLFRIGTLWIPCPLRSTARCPEKPTIGCSRLVELKQLSRPVTPR